MNNSMPNLHSRHSSSASSASSEDLLANDDEEDDDDEEEEMVDEEEVPGTQVLGNNVLIADAPMREEQWGLYESSDDDDEDLETPRRTPRSPSPSSLSSNGSNGWAMASGAGNFTVLERAVYFQGSYFTRRVGAPISNLSRRSFETVFLIDAQAAVRETLPTDAATRHNLMHKAYLERIDGIPIEFFADQALKNSMKSRLYGGQQNYNGKTLWDQASKRLKVIRNEMLPNFPANFKDLPSGTNFHALVRGVIRKLYIQEKGLTEDTPGGIRVPPAYVLNGKKTQTLIATLVHRNCPDIHESPADLPAGANRRTLRGAAHAQKQQEKADSFAAAKQQEVEFKQAKIAKERATLALGVMSERQKAITLKLETLEKYKDAYIEAAGGTRDSYLQAVSSLIKDMMAVSTDIPVDAPPGDSTTEEA